MTASHRRAPGRRSGSGKKIANSLVALSSAAVLTVYTAGYGRTRSAAGLFAPDGVQRRLAGSPESAAVAPTEAPPQPADQGELVGRSTPADTSNPSGTVARPPVPLSPAPTIVSREPIAISAPAPGAISDPMPATSPPPAGATALPPAAAPAPTEVATAPTPDAPAAEPATAPAPAGSVTGTTAPPAVTAGPRKKKYTDGSYSGWGTSRHGNILATVVVLEGQIVSAEITKCQTLYSCNIIDHLPPQVVSRQSAYVDVVSGATVSADAFANAIFRALLSAQK